MVPGGLALLAYPCRAVVDCYPLEVVAVLISSGRVALEVLADAAASVDVPASGPLVVSSASVVTFSVIDWNFCFNFIDLRRFIIIQTSKELCRCINHV